MPLQKSLDELHTQRKVFQQCMCVCNILVVIDDIFIPVVEDVVKMREEKNQIAVVVEGTDITYNTNFR